MPSGNLDINSSNASGSISSLMSLAKGVSSVLESIIPQVKDPEIQKTISEATGKSTEEIDGLVKAAEGVLSFIKLVTENSDQISTFISSISSGVGGLEGMGGSMAGIDGVGNNVSLVDELRDKNALKSPSDEALTSLSSASSPPIAGRPERSKATGTEDVVKNSSEKLTSPSSSKDEAVVATPAPSSKVSTGLSDTSHSAGGIKDLTAVPSTSPTYPTGPTKPIMDVLQVPASGPAADVIRQHEASMKNTYPRVQTPTGQAAALQQNMSAQNSGIGSQQPGSLHLTDQQARQLSEAIAHNINVRRAAEAQAMMEEFSRSIPTVDEGGYDSFGGEGANFTGSTEGANSFQEAVLMLADQVVAAGIPYAWGGGTLEGPSQGISDGGGAADANGDYAKIGFDCSGWARYCLYQAGGFEIPRTSGPQCQYCTPVSDVQIGDLGFPHSGNPGHVVVYVGNGTVCEAQCSGTNLMFSPASPSYVWGRPPESPNWNQ